MFAFFTCTNWHNPLIHRHSQYSTTNSNFAISGYLDCYSGLDITSTEGDEQSRRRSLQDIGGHIMKVPLIVFQILLFIRLQVYEDELCISAPAYMVFLHGLAHE